MLRAFLSDPLAVDLDLESPATRAVHHRMIRQKVFLHRIYKEWYREIAQRLPCGSRPVLEVGSGPGFLVESVSGLITSDVAQGSKVDLLLDAHDLPFGEGTLRGIVMVNVFHHLSRVRRFLLEGARCVSPGGALVLVEPWRSRWSEFVYRRFHHEPFESDAEGWECDVAGPMEGANGALPWMVFARDHRQFQLEFPQWQVEHIEPVMPLRYLLSGGLSMRQIVPGWSFGLWRSIERSLKPWIQHVAMFAVIELRRTGERVDGHVGRARQERDRA